ncbi:CPBP family intramembrane glutamic endopeptidase [Halalkalibaculum roseum]|uniref:CPBP family intramembrane glutamic endopeptidase n=1 Tax=Halalkalibaculum roseum TaxID=2709311 RepID=UPI0020119FE8|nr:CPBP family intramembrane glutamic endopeptidase [Halalkalibaculum roseum]
MAYGISWLLWAPLWLPAFGMDGWPILSFQHTLGAFGPMAAAFIVSAAFMGKQGVVALSSRLLLWRNRTHWIAIALLGPFVLYLLAVAGGRIITGESISLESLGTTSEFPIRSLIGIFLYNIFTFGYGEETGWRGFALPRLQQYYSAFTSTLMLTFFWALWHLPLFFYRPGYTDMNPAEIAGWFFSLLTGALLLTWLYNSSKGSVLVVTVFHASVNVIFTSDVQSDLVINSLGILITVWGIGVLLIAGPKYLSKKGKMIASGKHKQRLFRN